MTTQTGAGDPLDFVRGMWNNMGFSLPGMVTPTLDIDELDKRINDMKSVENWLKMNLGMLQMTIQGLEMQRATLAAVKAMSQQVQASQPDAEAPSEEGNPFANAAAMWPWNFMTPPAPESPAESPAEPPAAATPTQSPKPRGGRKPGATRSSK
ncbi:MAG: PhaM family polyhydroxyalkanoate granule multifunctional regulatory protein [Rhodocyclaceae bacterium]